MTAVTTTAAMAEHTMTNHGGGSMVPGSKENAATDPMLSRIQVETATRIPRLCPIRRNRPDACILVPSGGFVAPILTPGSTRPHHG